MADTISQPIIRGIQAVGSVKMTYRYNSSDKKLPIPESIKLGTQKTIDTTAGIAVAGFRLDGEFLRANPQIASSIVIPILGGGGVALTNNNRTGVLTLNCAKVSTPDTGDSNPASMYTPEGSALGVVGDETVYDMVTIAQIQQAQTGGDSVGATIDIAFKFCGLTTVVQFQGCTVATVDPLALTGNDAAAYQVQFNYLNWVVDFSNETELTTASNGVGG